MEGDANQQTPYGQFYLDEKTADVHFVLVWGGNEIRVPAHKILLASKSPTFYAMFYGELKETGDVLIVDVPPDVFKAFLKFFYGSEHISMKMLSVTHENVIELMALADKYLVNEYVTICKQFLEVILDINDMGYDLEELWVMWELAIKFNLTDAQEILEKRLFYLSENLLTSGQFLECSREILKRVLEKDLPWLPQVIFAACMAWVKNACANNEPGSLTAENIKKQLGECFYLIPFYLMDAKTILQIIRDHPGLFDVEEMIDLAAIMADDDRDLPELKKFQRKSCFTSAGPSECINWKIDRILEPLTAYTGEVKVFDAPIQSHAIRLYLDQEQMQSASIDLLKANYMFIHGTRGSGTVVEQFVCLEFGKHSHSQLIKLNKVVTFEPNIDYVVILYD